MSLYVFIQYLFSVLITLITVLYLQSKILNLKINYKSYNLYIGIILFIILGMINHINTTGFLRFIISTIYITFITCIIFKENIYKTFCSTVLEQFILFISELACSILFFIFEINIMELYSENIIYLLILNIIITLIAIAIYKTKLIKNLCDKTMNVLSSINSTKQYGLLLFFIVTLNLLLMISYSKLDTINILINTIFVIAYTFIIYSLIKEKGINTKVREENENLIQNLNEYEKLLDYQRVNNHENKNQLLVIKSMIHKNNKKALEYIDCIIKEKREDNELLYTKAKMIPEGGLQGLVYQKMLLMQENNIKVELNVLKEVRKINLSLFSTTTNYDICCIVGTLLDNAIEAVKENEKKEILISMYVDDYFNIEISNYFSGEINLSKIDKKGYTTKGKNRGYGLTLVKNIIDKNENIINERIITKDVFTQIVKIKM